MTISEPASLSVFAPAKVNLYLHLTGKRPDGYHLLDSLISFADIGDTVTLEQAEQFSFHIDGPFAKRFSDSERAPYLNSDNLVIKAARGLSQVVNRSLNVKITLTKNLPLAAGIGGGSSDAAAVLWGLQKLWNLPHNAEYMPPLMVSLGADVPVCFECSPTVIRGIGDELFPAPPMPDIPVVLVNPLVSCATADIFLRHSGKYQSCRTLPESFDTFHDLIDTLSQYENDLYAPAKELIPEIENVITALRTQKNCALARMSGSGATCFGLFETYTDAKNAQDQIANEYPDWWCQSGFLNVPERY